MKETGLYHFPQSTQGSHIFRLLLGSNCLLYSGHTPVLRYARHPSCSGPLHWRVSLPKTLFPQALCLLPLNSSMLLLPSVQGSPEQPVREHAIHSLL